MPSTTTPPTRWPAAISSLTMALIACAAWPDDTAADPAGGAADAGVVAVAQATAAWQIRPTTSKRSRSACRRSLDISCFGVGWRSLGLDRLGLDVIGGIDVARIPQHPSIGASIAGRLDLLADLVGAEVLSAKGVVGERLQPGPVSYRRAGRAPFALLERLVDDLVGVLDGIAVAGNAELEARRIEHGRDDVHHRRQILDPLADAGVILVPTDIAEGIHRQEHVVGGQPAPRLAQEAGDRPDARRLCRRLGVGDAAACIGETDIVELDLVEARGGGFLGHADRVFPGDLLEGIDPGKSLAILPQRAAGAVNRPSGIGGGQQRVLEGHDARDQVEVLLLERGHQFLEVGNGT